MTITALEVPNQPERVRVQFTSGGLTSSIDEHVGHVRSFYEQLGRLLDQVESRTPTG